jgi:hypothetical protein
MKAGKFQDISREIVGEKRQLLLQLEKVADRQRVELILLEYKAAVKAARGAMRKSLVKSAKRQAYDRLLATITANTAIEDIDSGEFSPGVLVAILQASIDTGTEAGKREWDLLEGYTSSKMTVDKLIASLRSWLVKLHISEPRGADWIKIWKLYAARKLTPVTASNLARVLSSKVIGSRIDKYKDYNPATIRDYVLALCADLPAKYRDHIQLVTSTEEGLRGFVANVLRLANQGSIPDPDQPDDASEENKPLTALLVQALPLLLAQIDNPALRVTPVPPELRFSTDSVVLFTDPESDEDQIRLARNEEGTLTPLDAAPDKSGPVSLGELAQITRPAAVGDFEVNGASSAGEMSGVREREFNEGLQAATVEESGVMVRDSEVLAGVGALSDTDEPVVVTTALTPSPSTLRADTPLNMEVIRFLPPRPGLWSSLSSLTGPMFAVAASMLIAAGLTGRPKEMDTHHSDMITDVRSAMHPLLSSDRGVSASGNAREICTDQVISAEQDTVRSVVSTTSPVFHTGDVLPQGPNTCIMGGAKHVLRAQFNIVDEMRLERLSNQAENAIRVARPAGMHTNPGDQVALAYDETNQIWLVRQIRDGQVIVASSFVAAEVNYTTIENESYFKPNFLHKLWTKGKSLWQSFKGFWA